MTSSQHVPVPGNGSPNPLPPSRAPRARAWRILLWIGASLALLIALAFAGAPWLGANLSQPTIKSKIQAIAHDAAGLTIDYDGLEISPFSGVRARFLRVAQPPKFKATAEDFVRIDDLDLRARAFALASDQPSIDAVRIGHIELTLVRDEGGATTLSELFPSRRKPQTSAPEKPTKLSHSLEDLPRAAIQRIAIASVAAKLIDLRAGAAPRTTTLASLGIDGAIHAEPDSLRGTDLKIKGAPSLRLEVQDGDRSRFADIDFALSLRADAAKSLGLSAHTELGRQNLLLHWPNQSELLNLDARVLFDASTNQTSVSISDFRALGTMLTATLGVELFDTEPMRILANGKANVDVERLPIDVDGLSLQDLKLALEAKKLSWQGDRIAGAIDWHGAVRSVGYNRDDRSGRIDDTSLDGHGAFDGPIGSLRASITIGELHAHTDSATAKLANLNVTVNGQTQAQTSGGQKADAEIEWTLRSAQAATPTGKTLTIDDIASRSFLGGTIADFSAKRLPKLQSKLALAEITAADGGRQSARLQQIALLLAVQDLAVDARTESGATGDASLSLELPSARVFDGPLPTSDTLSATRKHRPAKRSAALAVDGVKLHVELPLSLARAKGQLSLASLIARDDALKSLQLDVDLQNPLDFAPDRSGPAQAQLNGRIASVRAGTSHGVLEDARLVANRLDKDRYRVALNTSTSSVVANGRNVPGKITTELRADASPAAGSFNLSAAVRGAKGAAIDLKTVASFADADQRLRYDLDLSAEKLDEFATLIYGVAPSAAPVKVEGMRFHTAAKGEFSGVLKAQRGAAPRLVADPIASARGKQSFDLELNGLDYHASDQSLVVPELAFKLESVHGDNGAGSANGSFRAGSVEYDGDGKSIRLEGLDETIAAKFDRAPDQGVVDVVSKLQLGSVSQSIVPAYPIAGLHFSTHLQIDRLRSLFLREFAIANDETGTALHADGALELRTRNTQDDRKTLVGREALALKGQLSQALEPFQKLGFMSRASGQITVPFRLESGGLLGYRLLATLEAKQVSLTTLDHATGIENLNGVIPILEEFALLPGGPVLSAGPRSSPLAETRFFDVHPFLSSNDYVTAQSITLRGLSPLGPLAANVRLERSDFLIDQLQVGFNAGQIVGQVRIAYRDGDPLVKMRLDATGIRTEKSNDVFDANAALTFVPNAMTLDGKVQLVRVSRGHLFGILDVVDPFHESASANRIRSGLALGYPKFVRFQLHDGAVDTKVELGGLAKLVRIDDIKAVPLGPILQRYVAPTLEGYLKPGPEKSPTPLAAANAGDTR